MIEQDWLDEALNEIPGIKTERDVRMARAGAVAALARRPSPEAGWVSVEERLPAKPAKLNYNTGHFWCFYEGEQDRFLFDFETGEWRADDHSDMTEFVTHWRPLPAGPEGEA